MPFEKGNCANPYGRPKKPEIQLFRDAIEKVEKQNKKSLLQHAVEQAYKDHNVLIALMKKLLPDKLDFGDNDEKKLEVIKTQLKEVFMSAGLIK